jgi:myosin heavy subunit
MEAKFVLSPCGTRFPRTPENIEAFERGKGSIEKPEKAQDEVMKVDEDADVEVNEVEGLKEKLKVEGARMHEEMSQYRAQMLEMQGHLEMMERLMEDKDDRYAEEMEAGRREKRALQERIDELERSPLRFRGLEEKELSLREKEFELAKKKYDDGKAAEAEGADIFECCLSISDPSGDVLWDISRLRSLESSLRNSKTSVTTLAGLLDYALLNHEGLRQVMENVRRFSVRFVLKRFVSKFCSLYNISKASLSVISILLMGKIDAVKTRCNQVRRVTIQARD